MNAKTAVVLFNLGGPDSADAVEPFLFNMFSDPAIIGLPNPLRWALAKLIAHRRAPVARQIYAKIGNASPLNANTEAQAAALSAALGEGYQVFIAMRYWQPLSRSTAAAVKQWGAEEVLLLPLYPQFSSTTTASSIADWRKAATAVGLAAPTRAVCCYSEEEGFIAALAAATGRALAQWPAGMKRRILLSAHGLPERIIKRGDPYQWQVEATAQKLRAALRLSVEEAVLCYQSRVGPLAWLLPSTDGEVRRAGKDGMGLIVVPIAFVSEHSETLVELDIEYRHLAEASGVPRYVLVATVGTAPAFIAGLARLARELRRAEAGAVWPDGGRRRCPASCRLCPCPLVPAVAP